MTHLTVHCGPGGNHNGLGAFLDQIKAAGFTPWLKSVDAYGPLIDATSRGGYGVFRLSTRGQNDGYDYDVPKYSMDADPAAVLHWEQTKAKLPPELDRSRVWVEVMNEVDKNKAQWLGHVALQIARLANADGYKVLMFSFSSGEPEPEFWGHPNVLEYLRYCEQNPDMAGIALHEYNYGKAPYESVYPSHVGRFQYLYDACDRHGIDRPLVAITEWGFSQDSVPTWDEGGDYARKCFDLYSRYDIDGPALWCLQAYQGHPVPNQANAFMKAMAPWLASVGPQEGDRNAPLDPELFEPTPDPDPEPTNLEEWIWAEGMKLKVIDTNQTAALELAMGSDGYLQTGNEEYRTAPDGTQYALQPAYSAVTGENRVYYAEVPNWHDVRWQGQPEPTEPPVEPPPAYKINNIIDKLTKHPTKTYRTRELAGVESIVIHHSAVDPSVDAYRIAAYHVNHLDWPGIGYHYVVTAEGIIYQTNKVETLSYHVGRMNPQCVGICLLGNFTDVVPPQAQQDAAKWLVEQLQGSVLPEAEGTGHRLVPYTATSCPGATYKQWLGNVIGESVEPPPAPPPPPPPTNTVDLLPYFLPRSSEAWMLQGDWGPQEKKRTIHDAPNRTLYHVKNRNWERMHYDANYIYRSVDTSPGPDGTGRDRYYGLTDADLPFSRWIHRHARAGDWFFRSPTVRFFYKDNCEPITAYTDPTWLHVVAFHDTYHFDLTGVTVQNVLEMYWARTKGGPAIERYFYAGGLVGWYDYSKGWHSAIASYTVGDNEPEVIPCL